MFYSTRRGSAATDAQTVCGLYFCVRYKAVLYRNGWTYRRVLNLFRLTTDIRLSQLTQRVARVRLRLLRLVILLTGWLVDRSRRRTRLAGWGSLAAAVQCAALRVRRAAWSRHTRPSPPAQYTPTVTPASSARCCTSIQHICPSHRTSAPQITICPPCLNHKGFFATHGLNWTRTRVRELQCEQTLQCEHAFRTNWAPIVLVLLLPITWWRWRAWPMNAFCNWVKLLQISLGQFIIYGRQ